MSSSSILIKNITSYVEDFINTHGGDDQLLESWNDKANLTDLALLLKKEIKKTSSRPANLKEPDAPRRALNAYMFFCKENRADAVEEAGDGASAPDVARQLGNMWKELQASEKPADKKKVKKYQTQAAEDKARYEEEIKDYTRPSDDDLAKLPCNNKKTRGSGKKKRDPNKPKGALNGYMWFCKEIRTEAKQMLIEDGNSNPSVSEVAKKMGEMWGELDDDDKEPYQQQATEDKKRYEQEMANYNPPTDEDSTPTKTKKGKVEKKDEAKSESESESKNEDDDEKEPSPKSHKKSTPTKVKKEEKTSPKKSSGRKKTSYAYYCDEIREQVKKDLETKNGGESPKQREVIKALSDGWKKLSQEEKEIYEKMASKQ